MSGTLEDLSAEQKQGLNQFRDTIKSKEYFNEKRHDDRCLLRFLRARKFDVAKAEEMLDAAEKWRKEFNVDAIKESEFDQKELEIINKYYPKFYYKTDKDGRPVYIERLGYLNVPELYKATTAERMLKHLVYEYEKCFDSRFPACSKASGKHIETSCTILDMHNVGIKSFYDVKDYVAQASNIGQNYYPETMGKFYIINAPFLFTTVWSVVKGWLDPVTVSKIVILGKSYKDELLKQIPAENLPKDFGGKSEDNIFSDPGPWNVTPNPQ
ncbi:hypothetical protein E3P77_03731 [Wallemia ichthyophaga]|nr:hypothetical protein E3P77_03731 [Wallemia ichthyophaga]